jgi:hypothetical protein
MKSRVILSLFVVLLMSFGVNVDGQKPKAAKSDQIAPPELVAPLAGAKLNMFPRKTVFEWKHVDGANKYEIEVEYNDGKWNLLKKAVSEVNSYTLDFIGKQPGRWRVRSFSKESGKPGKFGEWRMFTYLK